MLVIPLKRVYAIVAVVLIVCLCVSVVLFGFIIDFSSGGMPYGNADTISYHTDPFQTYNETTVELSLGYTPPEGTIVLYCTYTITSSNHKVVGSSVMLHFPFSSEYIIDKKLTNLANDNYTFIITAHDADGSIRTPENQTFTVDTSFKYPVLTVTSPKSQTYDSNQVDINYYINSKVLWSYYSLDSADWVWFQGNMTLNNLSNGSHQLEISVKTEANEHIDQANEEQTIYFNVNSG